MLQYKISSLSDFRGPFFGFFMIFSYSNFWMAQVVGLGMALIVTLMVAFQGLKRWRGA
jgi:hypothetical protein